MLKSAVIEKSGTIEEIKVEKNKEKTRITYIDTAKAIAIFLTIVSHSGLMYHPINQFICSFHMPLFFFIAGWTQKNRTLKGINEWKNFILKKIYVLIVPFILYALIYAKGSEITVYKYIAYGTIFSLGKAGAIGVMWFLTCMFSATIIYQIIINIKNSINNKYLKNIVFGFILILSGLISNYFNYDRMPELGVPFNLNIALSAVLFMVAGNYTFMIYNICVNKICLLKKKIITLFIAILMLFVGSFLHRLNFEAFAFEKYNFGIVMAEAWYGNYFIFLINAIICSIGIVLLSMAIDNKFLNFFGRNTIIILYFHIQALRLTGTYITNKLPEGTYKCFVNAIVTFLEMGIVIPIINKFFPVLAGKSYPVNSKKEKLKNEKNI